MDLLRASETLELTRVHGSAYYETVTWGGAVSVCVSVCSVLNVLWKARMAQISAAT